MWRVTAHMEATGGCVKEIEHMTGPAMGGVEVKLHETHLIFFLYRMYKVCIELKFWS